MDILKLMPEINDTVIRQVYHAKQKGIKQIEYLLEEKQKMTNWIPVTERLPENITDILISFHMDTDLIEMSDEERKIINEKDRYGFTHREFFEIPNVEAAVYFDGTPDEDDGHIYAEEGFYLRENDLKYKIEKPYIVDAWMPYPEAYDYKTE